MPNNNTIYASVSETGTSPYAVTISVSDHIIIGDEPKESGGANLGPAPYDLLTAALGECTAMTVRWYALKYQWPLEKVDVFLTHQKIQHPSEPVLVDTFTKKVVIHGDLLTQEQRKKLIEIAAKCPIQRTLESQVEIYTSN